MRIALNIYLLIISLTLLISCHPTSQLLWDKNKDRILTGQVDENTYQSLREILASKSSSILKDTIIIKYNYNSETCWTFLDQEDDKHIMGFVTRNNQRKKLILAKRPNVSVFEFREPGDKINKIKKWDDSIIIDSSKELLNLLFKKPSMCGNSIILLPDRRFVFLVSDPHSDALDFPQAKIIAYLKQQPALRQ